MPAISALRALGGTVQTVGGALPVLGPTVQAVGSTLTQTTQALAGTTDNANLIRQQIHSVPFGLSLSSQAAWPFTQPGRSSKGCSNSRPRADLPVSWTLL